ncbi:MAG TPA: DUF1360 domain-containing protein [Rubrobacteraceae bacterium]|jgi:hypothetical protein|nr:DUF1360 domain-containing protein [Rubrobacteraceae bacterium]
MSRLITFEPLLARVIPNVSRSRPAGIIVSRDTIRWLDQEGHVLSDQTQQDNQVIQEVFEGYGEDPQALSSYAVLVGVFNLILATFLFLTKRMGRGLPERIEVKDIVLLGVATHKLSNTLANDAVAMPLRAPFTEMQEKQSPKMVDEEPRGKGLRKSVGELVTCKFCLGMWMASFFTYGLVLAPRVTRVIASIFAVVTLSDHLHQTYKALTNRA